MTQLRSVPDVLPRKTWKLTEEQKQEAARLYESGLSTRKVGEHFGLSTSGMRDILVRRTKMRPHGRDKTHCKRGHLLEGDNVWLHEDKRHCRACAALRSSAFAAVHPDKGRVQRQLREAVKRGEIERPTTCEWCERTGIKIQAHHPDYDHPFDVLWLCARCHVAEHRRLGKAA